MTLAFEMADAKESSYNVVYAESTAGRRRWCRVFVPILMVVIGGVLKVYRTAVHYSAEKEGQSLSTSGQSVTESFDDLPMEVFTSRVFREPRDKWARLENQTCLQQGTEAYPSVGSSQRRLPYAILIGSMKCGTTALSRYLYQHPYIVRPRGKKEIHFFDIVYDHMIAAEDGIPRKVTRQAYVESLRNAIHEESFQLMRTNSSILAIDDSPRYLFWSDRIPARVLCATPWAKVFAILRNPVDRAFSHYTMLSTSHRHKHVNISFEDWIELDLHLLKELRLIREWKNQEEFDSFAGSEGELSAWKAYTRTGTQGVLGRGLYALQLRQWFKAFEEFGKSRTDILVVRNEVMRANTEAVYRQVLNFLKLPYAALEDSAETYTGRYHGPMKAETQKKLENFFAPYNKQLYDLLGGSWNGVWD